MGTIHYLLAMDFDPPIVMRQTDRDVTTAEAWSRKNKEWVRDPRYSNYFTRFERTQPITEEEAKKYMV